MISRKIEHSGLTLLFLPPLGSFSYPCLWITENIPARRFSSLSRWWWWCRWRRWWLRSSSSSSRLLRPTTAAATTSVRPATSARLRPATTVVRSGGCRGWWWTTGCSFEAVSFPGGDIFFSLWLFNKKTERQHISPLPSFLRSFVPFRGTSNATFRLLSLHCPFSPTSPPSLPVLPVPLSETGVSYRLAAKKKKKTAVAAPLNQVNTCHLPDLHPVNKVVTAASSSHRRMASSNLSRGSTASSSSLRE